MPRPLRIISPDGCYHYFPRGSRQAPVFNDEQDYETYRALALAAKNKFGVKIRHYSLMPNHTHLMIEPSTPEITGFTKMLQGKYAVYFCKKYEISGNIWRQHAKIKPVSHDNYFLACGIYIENNAVRARIVSRPEQWLYSSYRHYALGQADPLIDDSQHYDGLDDDPKRRPERYRALFASITSNI